MKNVQNVEMTVDGRKFICSARQAYTCERLIEARKGGFASIKGYVSETGYIEPKVSDMTVLTRCSYMRLVQRKIDALKALTFEDVQPFMRAPKLLNESVGSLMKAFEDRRNDEIERLNKTLAGERDDARRQAHDYFYCHIGEGVRVHFKTEKFGNETMLVRDKTTGLPIVESILLMTIPLPNGEKIIEPGRRKTVNSGVPVLISNAMAMALPSSCKVMSLSLKEDKFTSIEIDGDTIIPKEIAGLFT